jgi:tRNA 2-selenouridine synthase
LPTNSYEGANFAYNTPVNTADYASILLTSRPLIDLRSPGEFSRGSFLGAVNLPLMSDEERHQIGIIYKQQGKNAAIALGHRLVRGDIKQRRIQDWQDFARAHPDGIMFCFRGGLRSRISQQWLREHSNIDYPIISGGYKGMRRYLIDSMEDKLKSSCLMVLAGRTGSGKTRLIEQLPQAVDLEKLANHRGSSFGRLSTPQPSQINFENALAIAMLRQGDTILVEDESHLIGSCNLPDCLYYAMKTAPLIVVETPDEQRCQFIYEDYVVNTPQQGRATFLLSALERIKKRLGGVRYLEVRQDMECALRHESRAHHVIWIKKLLKFYYDSMYDYQLQHKQERIVFRGDMNACRAFFGGQER